MAKGGDISLKWAAARNQFAKPMRNAAIAHWQSINPLAERPQQIDCGSDSRNEGMLQIMGMGDASHGESLLAGMRLVFFRMLHFGCI
jgi:hypothetical protein